MFSDSFNELFSTFFFFWFDLEFILDTKSDLCQKFRTIETLSKAKRPPILAIAVTSELSGSLMISIITGEKVFGYGSDAFKADVTYEMVDGNVSILYKKYDSRENKIVTQKSYVGKESNKLQCSSITPQYRAYKPKSLYEKLLENNSDAQNEFDSANREKLIIKYTVEKYKNLFPKAEITVGRDYYKNYRSNYIEFPIVMVKFESGSYISFRIGFQNDEEVVYKKHDAVASQLSAIELLNIFNQQ